MAVVGADVEQLRTLARTLTSAADKLEGVSSETTNKLASTPWTGSDATRYRTDWNGQSIAQIRTVVAAIRAAADAVLRNANEQEQASSATGGSSSGISGLLGPSLTLPFNLANPGPFWAGPLPNLLSPDLLQPFTDARDFFAQSTIWPIQNGTALGTTPLGPVMPLIDALGIAGDSTMSPDDKIVAATHSAIDVAGDLVQNMPGPEGYLGGVALKQWGDVYDAVSHADFSPQTRETVGNYIVSDPGGAALAASQAVVDYLPKLFSNVLPKFP